MDHPTRATGSTTADNTELVSFSSPRQHAKLLRSITRTVVAEPDDSYDMPAVIEAAEALAAALTERIHNDGGPVR